MQCPICASELSPDAVGCEKCGATRVTQRTPLGIIVGWVGMTVALLMVMMWIFMAVLPIFGVSLRGFPWTALIIGTAIAAGLFWYSKSTVHAKWVRRED
jgi:predicted nucleic acid-binding Zn ribbon protein